MKKASSMLRWLSSIQSGAVCAQMLDRTTPFELLFIIRAREAFRVTPAVTKVDSLLRAPSEYCREGPGSFHEASGVVLKCCGKS